jgi:hypothetical protein
VVVVWFYLSVQQSSKMWECGNREAISKDGGKDGKPAFGFPGFPRAVISTSRSVSLTDGSMVLVSDVGAFRARRWPFCFRVATDLKLFLNAAPSGRIDPNLNPQLPVCA